MRSSPCKTQHDLLRSCERALVDAARITRAGSRQQLRAAARRFVRAHRGDRAYLEWVLRSIGASAALAAALLGLGPQPAEAKATLFRVHPSNPLVAFDVGFLSTIAAGDLDADGDPDFVASKGFGGGGFHYFENTGNALAPALVERTGSENPLDVFSAGNTPRIALGDIDADGDLDLLSGGYTAGTQPSFFENVGSPSGPAFIQHIGLLNPFAGATADRAAPAFGDLDQDGDLDLVLGQAAGSFRYFENTGDAETPLIVQRTGAANPLNGLAVASFSTPALADLDEDGDLDLVGGDEPLGQFGYFENTGTPVAPAFVLRSGAANPLAGEDIGSDSAPAFVDLDGDRDPDLVSGDQGGGFGTYENLASGFSQRTGAANPLLGLGASVTPMATPEHADLDADGDLDLLVGSSNGTFYYFTNTGSAAQPAFVYGTNPLFGIDLGQYALLALGDLDHDGDFDLAAHNVGSGSHIFYFENIGTPATASFLYRTGSADPFDGLAVGIPEFADLDGDGDLDVVSGDGYTAGGPLVAPFGYYENTGSPSAPAFVPRTGSANPLDGLLVAGNVSIPAVADVDGDGDLDLVSGISVAAGPTLPYFENTGSATAPAFVARTGPLESVVFPNTATATFGDLDGDGDPDLTCGVYAGLGSEFLFLENALTPASPRYTGPVVSTLDEEDVGFFSTPAAADLDADGDLDFAASKGFSDGKVHYFENTLGPLGPAVVERTGSANPFDGLSAGSTPRLAFADVDADGDLDMVSGENYGAPLRFFLNTGSPTAPAFFHVTSPFNPFSGVIVPRGAPAFGDVDADGDLDLLMGQAGGTFRYYENTGIPEAALYVERLGGANPWNGLSTGGFSTPALGDVDRDGDLDLVAGNEALGTFSYFENTGTAAAPLYVERTGSANPLDGEDVGFNSSPTFADLDADSDLDLVSGRQDGGFSTYYLPEPGSTSLFAAGASLLAWLARRRSRSKRS